MGMVQLLAVLFHLQQQPLDWILSQAVPFGNKPTKIPSATYVYIYKMFL